MFGNFTIIDVGVDSWLIIFNILMYIVIALGVAIIVYATRKMSEKIRNSIYFMLFSILVVGFFRTTVVDYFSSLFWEISFIISQSFSIAVHILSIQILALIAFVVFVAFPEFFKFGGNVFTKKRQSINFQNTTDYYRDGDILHKGCVLKPLFHILS